MQNLSEFTGGGGGGNHTEAAAAAEEQLSLQFLLDGVLLTGVSITGLVCNCISVVVLLRPKMRSSSFNRFLATLAGFDLLYLCASLMIFGLPEASVWYREEIFPVVVTHAYGFAHVGRVGSVFLTAAVTVERYYAIVHPFRHIQWKTILLISASFFAVAYNVPRFFEVSYDPATNSTVQSVMRKSPVYITVYMFWSKFLLIELLPYLTIIVLNAAIVRSIRASKRFQRNCVNNGTTAAEQGLVVVTAAIKGRRSMETTSFVGRRMEEAPSSNWADSEGAANQTSSSAPVPASAACSTKEIRLATVLVTISVLFIACQSVKIIPDLYEVFFCLLSRQRSGGCETSKFIEMTVSVSHLLLAVNSSANFVIYVWRGRKFRSELVALATGCRMAT